MAWQIANTGKLNFLSRPRRFGKSLLLSTFESYFMGRKDLFEGPAIESLEKNWFTTYPVLHLDLNAEKYDSPERLVQVFSPELEKPGKYNELTFDETVEKMTAMYDSYHFRERTPGMFNPFSVLNALKYRIFDNYRFQTGTPTFLVDLLKQSNYDLRILIEGVEAEQSSFDEYRAETNNPIPLIYQSGYLTIKEYDSRFGIYTLCFPNEEVEYAFLKFLQPSYSSVPARQ